VTSLSACASLVSGRGSIAGAPNVNIHVNGDSGDRFDQQVKNSIADIESFWRQTYPKIENGAPLPPLKGGLYSVDGAAIVRGEEAPPAVSKEKCFEEQKSFIVDNAAYCPKDDSIIWDRSPTHLVPVLAGRFGPVLTAMVFAHEFGHAIQQRTGSLKRAQFTIQVESQADCAAGAFLAWALAGHAPHVPVTRRTLDDALVGYLQVRDSTPDTTADISHGNGFDRLNALQQGIQKGAKYCYAPSYFSEARFTERPYVSDTDRLAGGNLPISEMLGAKGISGDLNRFWRQWAASRGGKKFAALKLVRGTRPPCATGNEQLAFCPSGTGGIYVTSQFATQAYFSLDALSINPNTAAVSLAEHQPADFALGAMLGIAWAMGARHDVLGKPVTGQGALLAAICATGAYAANINVAQSPAHPFVLSPPDMDEATSAMLDLVPLPQAFGARGTDGLQRVEAFVRGYNNGANSC
jgi:predicted metalloprotease